MERAWIWTQELVWSVLEFFDAITGCNLAASVIGTKLCGQQAVRTVDRLIGQRTI
jgi:hypothetical protein